MATAAVKYNKRDFWAKENLNYVEPHFRLTKAARIVNQLARGREYDLLDVGCGPATMAKLLDKHIHYYGIDIAIHKPAPNLLQSDFVESPIAFDGRRFDLIVAQGVFEYMGTAQAEKFQEIADLLKVGGKFLVSYVNFNHRDWHKYAPYNNIQSFGDFRNSLEQFFSIKKFFPTSQRWKHREPDKKWMKMIQMNIEFNIPLLSRMFAVEYFFVCSAKGSGK